MLDGQGDRPAREVRLVAEPRPRSVAVDIVLVAHPDRRRPGGARRGLARLDPARPHDLGLLRLCPVFQSRPELPVLRRGCSNGRGRSWPRTSCPASCRPRATRASSCSPFGRRSTGRRAAGAASSALCPALAVVFLAIELTSLGSLFGFRTEFAMRAALLVGFAVSAAAIAILIARRRSSQPARLPAHPLGHLGLPHRPAGQPDRRALAGDLAAEQPLRRRRSRPRTSRASST